MAPLGIDLRGLMLEDVVSLLRAAGFSVSSRRVSPWGDFERAARGEKPGPAVYVVQIQAHESRLLTVTVLNGKVVTLEPGMNLYVSERAPGLLPGLDWFVAREEQVLACG